MPTVKIDEPGAPFGALFFCAKCLPFDALVEVEQISVAKLAGFADFGNSAITAVVLGDAYS